MSGRANRVVALGRRLQPRLPAPLVRLLVSVLHGGRRFRRSQRGGMRRRVGRVSSRDRGEVTVVVTSFNDARFLDDCLDSLARQTYPYWRCLVVDDASTDDSVAVIARHAAADSRIQLVRHGVNAGLSAARNSGLLRSATPWVCFLDGDDFLLDASLADRVEVLAAAGPATAGSYSGSVTVTEHARLGELPARLEGDTSLFEDLLSSAGACPFPAHAPMLRREVLVDAGGFDESMRTGAEDWDMWLRLMRSGYAFVGSGARTVAYRMKRASMVGRDPSAHLAVGRRLLDSVHHSVELDTLVPGGPAPLSGPLAEHLRSLEHARRVLAFAPLIAVDDPGHARAAIDAIDPAIWPVLDRRDDIDRRVGTAALRAEQIHPLGADANALSAMVSTWVAAARGRCVAVPTRSSMADLVVAANAAEVRDLFDANRDSTWLSLDREDGNHGVGDALRRRGITPVTVSDLALGGVAPNRVTVGSRPTATAARLSADPTPTWSDLLVPNLALIEEYADRANDSSALAEFAGAHAGERAVIIGNGPSLRETDLSLLRNEVTFGVNGIFYLRDEMGFDPTYYVVEDTSVMRENLSAIRRQEARRKFFPSMYRDLYNRNDAVYFNLNRGFYEQRSPNAGTPRFSVDAAQRLYAGQSVTYINLQLAYFMGFTSVVLVGVDFDYVIPDDAERDGEVLTSRGPDPNHFHPDYFGAGKTWKDPHLDRVAANYQLAREMFEADGREVLNATVGGKLEVFPRIDLSSLGAPS